MKNNVWPIIWKKIEQALKWHELEFCTLKIKSLRAGQRGMHTFFCWRVERLKNTNKTKDCEKNSQRTELNKAPFSQRVYMNELLLSRHYSIGEFIN